MLLPLDLSTGLVFAIVFLFFWMVLKQTTQCEELQTKYSLPPSPPSPLPVLGHLYMIPKVSKICGFA
jgi:hypothetical protein